MRLYSSLSRRKEELPPPPGPIGMYFCGPTVYQRIHVGNARPFVISMWLKRWLELQGYTVTLVENITDINDKIYDAAPGASAELAADASLWYVEDTGRLGLGRPDREPKASETVGEIVALIEELVRRDLAYEAGGDVYFRVARYREYGQLSGQRPDEVQEQEPNPLKEDPRDFALWKATKEGEDTSWGSPWGRGRPGWHIECSAMAERFLGPSFEIHGGGLDLVFPHHENELAQSRGAGRDFARVWMHNGMLRLTGEKMSKSLGNIATLQEVLDEWGAETVLLFFMTAHWRKPIDFSEETMAAARAQVESFRNAHLVERDEVASAPAWDDFAAALADDFSTPDALAILHEWRSAGRVDELDRGLSVFGLELDREEERVELPGQHGVTAKGDGTAGGATAVAVFQSGVPEEIRRLAQERFEARARSDFAAADELRRRIDEAGYEIQDRPDGYRVAIRR
jgi:cysteinyl-tRNA synthetase